jgi:predicted ATPase
LLEAASVAGIEFSAETVAAALHIDEPTAEHECDELVHRHLFVRVRHPSGTAGEGWGTQYTFRHALFHHVVYNRLGVARRRQFHQQVGEQKERAYGARAVEIAAALAIHFTESGDTARAVQYLQQAARTALRRSAHREANTHLTHALE